jgi:hypothetical protein
VVTRRFPVKPKGSAMGVGILFFGACAAFLFWRALTIEHGDTFFGIKVEQGTARALLFVMASLSVCMVGAACWALLAYWGRELELVIDDVGVSTPGPVWNLGPHSVRFADVVDVKEHHVSGQSSMTLKTATQKVWFTKSMLPPGAYDEAVALVKQYLSVRN